MKVGNLAHKDGNLDKTALTAPTAARLRSTEKCISTKKIKTEWR
jgi:hypothetical protein